MGYDIPITFIIFNRPESTQKVFNVLRMIKPNKLYVISDFARNDDEIEIVNQTRAIIDSVDWDCEVNKNYSTVNLGCGRRVSSGLDWVFSKEDYSIILEDDCVPNITFFRYAKELLLKYRYEEKIMYISGDNFHKKVCIDNSYDFVKIGWIWGWATWKRAWKKYDFEAKNWLHNRKQVKEFYNNDEYGVFAKDMDEVIKRNYHTWDYQWQYCCALNGGLCIIPKVNLINNIGFGSEATHTKSVIPYYDGNTYDLEFPLTHPNCISPNNKYDRETLVHMKNFEQRALIRILKRIKHMLIK